MMKQFLFHSMTKLIVLMLSLLQIGCVASRAPLQGLPKSDEELLAAIAKIAQLGPNAVCDQKTVETELGVVIEKVVIENRNANTSEAIRDETSITIRSKDSKSNFKSAAYVRFSSKLTSFCRIAIQFEEDRLCDRKSLNAHRIMGGQDSVTATTQHTTQMASVMYKFNGDGNETVVTLGGANQQCGNQFSISSKGLWK
jgi:hypothetical protein